MTDVAVPALPLFDEEDLLDDDALRAECHSEEEGERASADFGTLDELEDATDDGIGCGAALPDNVAGGDPCGIVCVVDCDNKAGPTTFLCSTKGFPGSSTASIPVAIVIVAFRLPKIASAPACGGGSESKLEDGIVVACC